jgi:4a-hydroxytetrahydrobiopterin dehydratase
MHPPRLTQDEISNELDHSALQMGWSVRDGLLHKKFSFPTYLAGAQFVAAVADQAERLNHHPELLLGWRSVVFQTRTHSADGLTSLDFELARRAEGCLGAQGATAAV